MDDLCRMSSSTSGWKTFFCNWPEALPRRGLLTTSYNEQIPFAGFLTSELFLLLDRQTPDAMGARMVIIPYDNVTALKLIEVIDQKTLHSVGFEGSLKKR